MTSKKRFALCLTEEPKIVQTGKKKGKAAKRRISIPWKKES